jgi:hypothetical protein
MLTLVRPSAAHLPAYAAALARGWSPDTMRPEVAQEQLARIAEDAPGFLASLEDEDPQGATVTLPDGSRVPRLPWLVRWMWDRGLAGSINLRWPPAGAPMPPHVLGHIGFSVVPGSGVSATPPEPSPSSCRKPAPAASRSSSSPPSPGTPPRNAPSRRTAAAWSSASRRPPPTAAAPPSATASTFRSHPNSGGGKLYEARLRAHMSVLLQEIPGQRCVSGLNGRTRRLVRWNSARRPAASSPRM